MEPNWDHGPRMVGEVQSDLEAAVVVGEERKASGLERKQTMGKRRVVGRREWSLRREGVRIGRLVGGEVDEVIESQLELVAALILSSKGKEGKGSTRTHSSSHDPSTTPPTPPFESPSLVPTSTFCLPVSNSSFTCSIHVINPSTEWLALSFSSTLSFGTQLLTLPELIPGRSNPPCSSRPSFTDIRPRRCLLE